MNVFIPIDWSFLGSIHLFSMAKHAQKPGYGEHRNRQPAIIPPPIAGKLLNRKLAKHHGSRLFSKLQPTLSVG
jgi:hypothetical protein